jgi:hypothetical protein
VMNSTFMASWLTDPLEGSMHLVAADSASHAPLRHVCD